MSFLYPAFLAGAAAAAIPIILHLLTREAAPRLPFSAVRFLRRIPIADSRRRLRELLLLALRVTALALLAFAFARPYFVSASGRGGRLTVLAVDTSFSMGAPGRFARAQALARDAVNRAGLNDRVAVVAFADTADVVAHAGDPAAALAAIDRLHAGFGATRYAPAIAKAVDEIGGGAGRIILVTDLQKTGWDASPAAGVPQNVALEVADAGASTVNLAITGMRIDAGNLVATIRNAGSASLTTQAHLRIDDRLIADIPVALDAGAFVDVRFPQAVPQSGVASVSVDDAQGFPADNVRFLVLDPPARASVLAITTLGNAATEAFYLERALLVNERGFTWTTISVGDLRGMAVDGLTDRNAVLLLGTRGLERRGRETLANFVENGGALFMVAGPDLDADAPARIFSAIQLRARARESGAAVTFAPTDLRHPIFSPFGALSSNLGRVRFDRSIEIDAAPNATILARFSDGRPALLEYTVGRGRILYFASDLNKQWNDFPLQPVFVPFVQSVMRYLTTSVQRSREYLVADAPAGAPRQPGVIVLPADKNRKEPRRMAINVDVRESDLARIDKEQLTTALMRSGIDSAGASRGPTAGSAASAAGNAAQQDSVIEGRQNLWRYGLILMLASLVFESALARKM